MSAKPFIVTISHRDVQYIVSPNYSTLPDLLDDMVRRIKVKIRQLEEPTDESHGTVSVLAREIKGMIQLLAYVLEAPALIRALEDELESATWHGVNRALKK